MQAEFWRVDADPVMFTVAEARPYIWRNLLLNDYMRAGSDLTAYLNKFRGKPHANLKALVGRFMRGNEALTTINNLVTKYTAIDVRQLRTLVINLFNILNHLKAMMEQADYVFERVAKPEYLRAMCQAFIRATGSSTKITQDSSPIEAVRAFYGNDQNFGTSLDHAQLQQFHVALFKTSKGDSLETMNPCQMMQNLFLELLRECRAAYPESKFIVQGLPADMCCAQQCCELPYHKEQMTKVLLGKEFKAARGFNRIAPDKQMVDMDSPWLRRARVDFFIILVCSGYFGRDQNGHLKIPLTTQGWQNAFFDSQSEGFMVPQFNAQRLRAICETVATLRGGETQGVPLKSGPSKGRLGYDYVLITAPEAMEVEVGTPGVDVKAPAPTQVSRTGPGPVKRFGDKDTQPGMILIAVAVALLAVTVLR